MPPQKWPYCLASAFKRRRWNLHWWERFLLDDESELFEAAVSASSVELKSTLFAVLEP